ncbi:hypothetical protein JCM18900_11862 [Psychrobacter sp. JCM 18900]|nr:hypothetical protein JCM18900_11862 [Psychrobacter sp. JCM 18900]
MNGYLSDYLTWLVPHPECATSLTETELIGSAILLKESSFKSSTLNMEQPI